MAGWTSRGGFFTFMRASFSQKNQELYVPSHGTVTESPAQCHALQLHLRTLLSSEHEPREDA